MKQVIYKSRGQWDDANTKALESTHSKISQVCFHPTTYFLRHKNARHYSTLIVASPPGFTTSLSVIPSRVLWSPSTAGIRTFFYPAFHPPSTLLPCWPRLLPESLDWEERGHRRSIKLSHRSLFPLLSPSKLPVAPHQWPVWQPGAQEHWGGRNVRYISTPWRKTTGAVGHDIWGRPLFRWELFEDRK